VRPTRLVDRVIAELAHQGLTVGDGDGDAADRALASLRIGILVEQVFGLTLSDEELGLDLTDPTTLRRLLDGPEAVR